MQTLQTVPSPPPPRLSLVQDSESAARVLLVEDDPEYARVVERALRRSRPAFWVHREPRLDAALGRLERERYDAMIVDLGLPDGAGRATLGYACAVANHLPVLVLTGNDDESLSLIATRAGAQDYLVKQRTHALTLSGAVLRAIARYERFQRRPARRPAALHIPAFDDAPGRCVGEALLLDRLDRAIARAERRRERVAVFVAALDDLELLEHILDPASVDALLARAALRISRSIRHSDTVAILPSRRFAIVLETCPGPERLRAIGGNLRGVLREVAESEQGGSQVVGFVIRVGASTYPIDGSDAETLLENADAAADRLGMPGGVGLYSHGPGWSAA